MITTKIDPYLGKPKMINISNQKNKIYVGNYLGIENSSNFAGIIVATTCNVDRLKFLNVSFVAIAKEVTFC